MATEFGGMYGDLARALKVHGKRLDVLANNLANADTPNFKARDIDFRAALKSFDAASPTQLETSHKRHIGPSTENLSAANLKWRLPSQPSADGNTVDGDLEKARFGEAAVRYEATMRFIDGRVKSLLTAISGQ